MHFQFSNINYIYEERNCVGKSRNTITLLKWKVACLILDTWILLLLLFIHALEYWYISLSSCFSLAENKYLIKLIDAETNWEITPINFEKPANSRALEKNAMSLHHFRNENIFSMFCVFIHPFLNSTNLKNVVWQK